MAAAKSSPKRIRDVFYETRVLMGRDYTIRRFAEEALASAIDPVMLGYIEKGKRFPNEALVRRLAAIRKELAELRQIIKDGGVPEVFQGEPGRLDLARLEERIAHTANDTARPTLRPVINGTGIIN